MNQKKTNPMKEKMKLGKRNMMHRSLPWGFDTVMIGTRSEGRRELKRTDGNMGFCAGKR